MIIPNIWENKKCSKPPTSIKRRITSAKLLVSCPERSENLTTRSASFFDSQCHPLGPLDCLALQKSDLMEPEANDSWPPGFSQVSNCIQVQCSGSLSGIPWKAILYLTQPDSLGLFFFESRSGFPQPFKHGLDLIRLFNLSCRAINGWGPGPSHAFQIGSASGILRDPRPSGQNAPPRRSKEHPYWDAQAFPSWRRDADSDSDSQPGVIQPVIKHGWKMPKKRGKIIGIFQAMAMATRGFLKKDGHKVWPAEFLISQESQMVKSWLNPKWTGPRICRDWPKSSIQSSAKSSNSPGISLQATSSSNKKQQTVRRGGMSWPKQWPKIGKKPETIHASFFLAPETKLGTLADSVSPVSKLLNSWRCWPKNR